MRIDIITVLPEMIEGFFNYSIMSRAQKKGIAEIHIHNLRDYAYDRYRKVDDYPFGGCAGMVMKIEPIDRCISALKAERHYDEVIFTTPDGEQFNQKMANTLSLSQNLIILCGHFKGIDYRIREHFITKEISIGDYVLTGGELAAAVIADSIVRIIPGVISDEQSALSDSFQDNLLAPPVYTRPAEYNGWKVPDILLSGHEAKIREWEFQQSLERTQRLRPDLLEGKLNKVFDISDVMYWRVHYVRNAYMHVGKYYSISSFVCLRSFDVNSTLISCLFLSCVYSSIAG